MSLIINTVVVMELQFLFPCCQMSVILLLEVTLTHQLMSSYLIFETRFSGFKIFSRLSSNALRLKLHWFTFKDPCHDLGSVFIIWDHPSISKLTGNLYSICNFNWLFPISKIGTWTSCVEKRDETLFCLITSLNDFILLSNREKKPLRICFS